MRSIDMRVPLLVGVAIALLAVSPAKAATDAPHILFVSGTGDAAEPKAADDAVFADSMNDTDDTQADLTALSAKMADTKMQDGVARAVEQLTETMLDLPIGKFAAAIEQSVPGANKGRKRIRANDTLADVAGRDAEHLPEQLASGSRQMMGMMSGLAAAFATMLPEFEKMGKALDESLGDLREIEPKDD